MDYWTSFHSREDFSPRTCRTTDNRYLTRDYLFELLRGRVTQGLPRSDSEFRGSMVRTTQVELLLQQFPEGRQVVSLRPYYLRNTRTFGFLVDFRFRQNPNQPFTRQVQLHSLSLDKTYRSNTQFYRDRLDKIGQAIERFWPIISPLSLQDETKIELSSDFTRLRAYSLKSKQYAAGSSTPSNSQFLAIKNHGPLETPASVPKLLFAYQPPDKRLSHDLYHALRGRTFPTFPGMREMFGVQLDPEDVDGHSMSDFSRAEIEQLFSRAQKGGMLPVIVGPFGHPEKEDQNEAYYTIKHQALLASVPCQLVGAELIADKRQFKWSISNIALQVFAKMGGVPWKVIPQTPDCLIMGLGQAHLKRDGVVQKYFAYSVLTDSSGLYKDLQVLGDSHDRDAYLGSFRDTLKRILLDHVEEYTTLVIHAPFKIREAELDIARTLLDELDSEGESRKLYMIMVNDPGDLFAYDLNNNSMTPYESTYVELGGNEFLVWFEGLQYNKPTLNRRVGRPVLLSFHRAPDDPLVKRDLIQDCLNLSGANWRGFNAKALPVSIWYPRIIARFVAHFDELGFDRIDMTAVRPWFL